MSSSRRAEFSQCRVTTPTPTVSITGGLKFSDDQFRLGIISKTGEFKSREAAEIQRPRIRARSEQQQDRPDACVLSSEHQWRLSNAVNGIGICVPFE